MREPELSLLERELGLASEAARKLSIALSVAWAALRSQRQLAKHAANEEGASPGDDNNKAGGEAPMSSDQEDLFS